VLTTAMLARSSIRCLTLNSSPGASRQSGLHYVNPRDNRGCGKSHMPMPRAGYPGHTPSPGVTPQAPVIGEAPSPPCGASSCRLLFLDAVRVQSHADDSRAGDAHGEASDGGKQFQNSEANSTSTMARGRTVACRASVGVIFSLGMAHSQGPHEKPSRLALAAGLSAAPNADCGSR